jgi:hypothetical protein
MSFEDAWYAATYNLFWFMKFLIPVIAALLAMLFRSRRVHDVPNQAPSSAGSQSTR